MSKVKVVFLISMLLFSAISFIIGFFQFREKGFLLNNAYIYASEKERSNMNKAPYYRQSAIVFFAVGIMFIMTALTIITDQGWPVSITIVFSILLIIYAINSSVIIARKQK